MKENLGRLLLLMQSYSCTYPITLPYPKYKESVITRPIKYYSDEKLHKRDPSLVKIEKVFIYTSQLEYFINYIFSESQKETPSNELKKTEIGIQLINTINQLISKCKDNKKLISIIFDSVFSKQYDLGESPLENSTLNKFHIIVDFLIPTFMNYLQEQKCSTVEEFQALKITSLINFFSALVTELTERESYKYQVTFFVNSPYWEEGENPIKIGKISLSHMNNPVSRVLYADYANDEDLDLIKADFPSIEMLCQINMIFYYFIEVELNIKKDKIKQLFLEAEHIGQKLQTNLRLVYDLESSVSCLRFIPSAFQTPDLFGITTFDPKYSFLTITRRWFYPELSSSFKRNLEQFADLCQQSVEPPGLEIAIRRFNSTIDNFPPLDPEKGLDIAIALESLFLNDMGSNNELTFRLQLRAAVFLETKYEKRHEIFETLKVLYKNRSRIVHGGRFKESELKDIIENNEKSLKILQIAMIKFSSSHGKKIKDWNQYWINLLLGKEEENDTLHIKESTSLE